MDYPLFEPPAELVERGIRQWSSREAEWYRDWLLSVMPARIQAVQEFLELPDSSPPESQLAIAGVRMGELLPSPKFSRLGRREDANLRGHLVEVPASLELTTLGYALAADLGLLMPKFLVDGFGLRWEIVRKPKSDVFYNRPVVAGFGSGTYMDPIHVSHVISLGVLDGSRRSTGWVDLFRRWSSRAPRQVS
jgi:hypothetical protein